MRSDLDYSGSYAAANAKGGGGLNEVFLDAPSFNYTPSQSLAASNGFVYANLGGFANVNLAAALSLPDDWVKFRARVVWFLVGANVVDPMMWQLHDRFIDIGDDLVFSWPAANNAEVGDPPVNNKLMETVLHAADVTNVPGKLYQLRLDVKGQDGNSDGKGFCGVRFVKSSS
jgi:hypothetical protein